VPLKFKVAPDPTTIAAEVFAAEVILENGIFVNDEVETQEGAADAPFDCKIYPLVPGVRETIVDPEFAYTTPFVVRLDARVSLMVVPLIEILVPAVSETEPVCPPILVTPELEILVQLTEIPLPAVRVTAPVCPWTDVTLPVVSRLMVGFCPPVDFKPVPAFTP